MLKNASLLTLAASSVLALGACASDGAKKAHTVSKPKVKKTEKRVEKEPTPKRESMAANIAKLRARQDVEARVIEVEHILIAFAGSMRSRASRSQAEAKKLAEEIFANAISHELFDELKVRYTSDRGQKSADGTYRMYDATRGGKRNDGQFARAQMAKGFGNTSWKLQVGEIGVAPYDQKDSPFGWHIIRRVK